MTVIDLLWERDREVLYITREQYEQGLEGWAIEEVRRDGALIGAVLTNGPRIHFATFAGETITREHLRRYLGTVIEQHGYALTTTPKDDQRQRRFNERCGWYVIDEDELDVHMRIDRLRPKEK